MYPGENVDLLVFFVEEVLQILDFCLQIPHPLFQRFGVSSREGAATQFVARFTFESNAGTLRTAWANTITANLLASASVAGLGDAALGAADLDHFHWQDTRHFGGMDGRIGRRGFTRFVESVQSSRVGDVRVVLLSESSQQCSRGRNGRRQCRGGEGPDGIIGMVGTG